MAKDPAFLFYPGDWMGGTMVFSRHQKGAYIDLLMGQFHNGHMGLHMVETILGEKDFAELWETTLKPKFKVDNECKYYNEKLDYETTRRRKYTKSRLENLSHMKDHMGSHMDAHMENGNGISSMITTKATFEPDLQFSGFPPDGCPRAPGWWL